MTTATTLVSLAQAEDAQAFGGKAAQLAVAIRAGLPVPDGLAAAWPFVDAVAAAEREATAVLRAASASADRVAVRSSGVGEDSAAASFAGQHLSRLNVPASEVPDVVGAVWSSASGEAALGYRRRMGLAGTPRIAVVIQQMLDADVAGVLFHPHPVTGADEYVVEAAWGLGEAVVGGLVTPDLFRLDPQGQVLERRAGLKDVAVVARAAGGTEERPVEADRTRAVCLHDGQLAEVFLLAKACKRVFGGSQDLEWAFAQGRLWLLQRRTVTGAPPA